MLNRAHTAIRGFTLIELIIVIAIISILLSIGIPGFNEWVQNTQLRTAAEGVMNGMQQARSEAVRRNARVEFVLTNPGVRGGTGWRVQLVRDFKGENPLQTKPDGEASANATLTVTPAGATTITFNGYGRNETTNADGSAALTMVDVDNTTITGARKMRVTINSGTPRMCDPQVTNAGDTRKC